MNVFEHSDYKAILRTAIKERQKTKKSFTLKKLSSLISIRNTYLSRLLNEESSHFSEDHLYLCCKYLGLEGKEAEYVLLLRTHATTSNPVRKEFLGNTIDRLKKENQLLAEVLPPERDAFQAEMEYLLDPYAMLLWAAMGIPEYQKTPLALCAVFGISIAKLKEVLKKLDRLELIEFEEQTLQITKVLKNKIHFGRDHPLMRTHQSLLKTMINTQVTKTSEENKVSFLATFSSDPEGFEKAKVEFQKFLKAVEQIAHQSKPKSVYQLNFDLIKWA